MPHNTRSLCLWLANLQSACSSWAASLPTLSCARSQVCAYHFCWLLPFYSLINDHLHWWDRNMEREVLLLQNPRRMFEKHSLKAEDLRTDYCSLSSYWGQDKCEGLTRGKKPLKLEGLHSSQMSQVSLLIWNRAYRRGTGDVNYARKMEQNSNEPTNGLGRLHRIV